MAKVIIEVSARHCHLSQKDLVKLFGKGCKLKVLKPLSQKGEFASKEEVVLKTKDGEMKLRVLGPARKKTQVEISMTEARKLKINPPLRLSGDIKKSEKGILIGPKGKITLKEGIIIAKRHIHCDPLTAKKLKLKQNQKVRVKTFGDRSLIFDNVIVRIDKSFVLRMHLDTDEGNASLVKNFSGEKL